MRIIFWLAVSMLAGTTTHAQLVKTLYQTFELPDSVATLSFDVYEKDSLVVVPWAGNTIMTESNIKLYYASRGVFDHLLEKGRYNFESRENGDKMVLASTSERRLEVKLTTAKGEGKGQKEQNEQVAVRVFIPDAFTQAAPDTWTRPFKERSEERTGAYHPRKKLNRESGEVSEELRDAIPEAPKDTVVETLLLPMPDSTWRRQSGLPEKPKDQ